jgi:hypothetical protein
MVKRWKCLSFCRFYHAQITILRSLDWLAAQNGAKISRSGSRITSWLTLTWVWRFDLQRSLCTEPQPLFSDTSASGSRLKAAGSPLLAHLLRETAEQIPHPTSEERSLWDARGDSGTLFGEHMNAEIAAMHEDELLAVDSIGVSPLGSGSDYTIFLQYHGVSKWIAKYVFRNLHLTDDTRCQVLMVDSPRHYTIPCITITRFLTLSTGKSCMVILASLVMWVLLGFLPAHMSFIFIGCYCQTYWPTSASSVWRHYFTVQYYALLYWVGIIPRQVCTLGFPAGDLWLTGDLQCCFYCSCWLLWRRSVSSPRVSSRFTECQFGAGLRKDQGGAQTP